MNKDNSYLLLLLLLFLPLYCFLCLTFCSRLYCNLRLSLRFYSASSSFTAAADLEHVSSTCSACSRYCLPTVLHSYLFFAFHFPLCLTFYTICLCSHYFHNS